MKISILNWYDWLLKAEMMSCTKKKLNTHVIIYHSMEKVYQDERGLVPKLFCPRLLDPGHITLLSCVNIKRNCSSYRQEVRKSSITTDSNISYLLLSYLF